MRWRVCDSERERAFQGSDVCAGNVCRLPTDKSSWLELFLIVSLLHLLPVLLHSTLLSHWHLPRGPIISLSLLFFIFIFFFRPFWICFIGISLDLSQGRGRIAKQGRFYGFSIVERKKKKGKNVKVREREREWRMTRESKR